MAYTMQKLKQRLIVYLLITFGAMIVVHNRFFRTPHLTEFESYVKHDQHSTQHNTHDVTTTMSLPVTKCRPEQRRKFVQTQCKTLHGQFPNNSFYSRDSILEMSPERRYGYAINLLVDDKHKLLFCSNAKVGATTYKYLLAAHSDNVKTKDGKPQISMNSIHADSYLEKFNLTCMGKFSDRDILNRLKNYRKVMTTRDPLLRAFLSYREKLALVKPPHCQPYQRSIGKSILERYRTNLTEEEKNCGYTVTFPEFIRYIASPHGYHILRGDAHWNQFYLKCQPCVIDYDYYILIETGDSDQEYFLDEYLHSEQAEFYGASEVRFNNVGNSSECRLAHNEYVQTESQYAGVNMTDFERIRRHYEIDSYLFGYTQTLNEDGMSSTCRSTYEHEQQQCC